MSLSALGKYSIAAGTNCIASGPWSYAFGDSSQATSDNAMAVGNACVAGNRMAFAAGMFSHVTGMYGSSAIGAVCLTTGHNGAHSEGLETTAGGDASHAGGKKNVASAHYSAVIAGTGNTCAHERSAIIGGTDISSTATDTVYVPSFEIVTQGESSFIMKDAYNGSRYKIIISGGTLTTQSI